MSRRFLEMVEHVAIGPGDDTWRFFYSDGTMQETHDAHVAQHIAEQEYFLHHTPSRLARVE